MTSPPIHITPPADVEIAAKADAVKAQIVQFAEKMMTEPQHLSSQVS